MQKYKKFRTVNEVRRPKQCPILDFTPIINSEVYSDMMAMGFVEVTKGKYDELETVRADVQRSFKDSLGNIGFYHPLLGGNKKPGYPYYNIKFSKITNVNDEDYGLSYLTIKVNTGPSKSAEYPNITRKKSNCINTEDYLSIMGFLIKVLIQAQGFPVSDSELKGEESYKDLILRKINEDPSSAKDIEIPPSLKKEGVAKGVSILKRGGFFKNQ
jgi:hypothetical protein